MHTIQLVWSHFSVCGLQTGGLGWLVTYEDYGFILKMKMTEVSNPMQRKQKRLGMGSNSFDLNTLMKCSACFQENDTVLNYVREKLCKTEKDRMNSGLPITCRSLTAECSLANNSQPPFLSWSEAFFFFLLDPKIVDLTEKSFSCRARGSRKCLLCLVSSVLLCITENALAVCFFGGEIVLQNSHMT